MSKSRSAVYQFFEFVGFEFDDKSKTKTKIYKCLICGEEKRGQTTSNLITHLELAAKECSKHEEAERKYNEMKNATTFGTPVRNAKRQRPNEDQLAASPLLNFFRPSAATVTKYGINSSIQKDRAGALLNMLTKCMLPIRLVENKEFVLFLNKLDPYFNVPTAKTMNRSKLIILFEYKLKSIRYLFNFRYVQS